MRKVLAALIVAAGVALPNVSAVAVDAPVSIRSLGGGDTDVRGMYGNTSFFVPIPPGTAVSGPVSVDVEFSHSELLLPDISTMTVRVNDVSLGSTFLNAANRNRGHLVVAVPNEVIGTEGLFVEARFFLRLTRDACEEPTNPALWATVHGASVVTMPTAYAGPRDLRDVPDLVIPASTKAAPLTIVLPEAPNDTLLRAAGVAAAAAGRWLGEAGRDAAIVTARAAPVDGPSIQLGVALDVPGVNIKDAPKGVIAVDQAGPVRVVVTGPTAAAALAAARSLASIRQFDGPAALLTGKQPASDPTRTPPWTKSAASFRQLGIDRLDAAGPGTKVFDFVVARPEGWVLKRTGHLDIDINTAPGVRRGPAYVQAVVNGFDLGTRRLEPGGGTRRYRFEMAGALADRDIKGRPLRALRVRLRVHLAPEQRTCTPLDAEATRASVLPTSKFTLPHESGGRLDLGRFPSSLDSPLIAIDGNNDDSVATGLQAAASIGRWRAAGTTGDGAYLAVASKVTPELRKAHDLILLGDADAAVDERILIDRGPVATGPASAVAFAGLVPSPFRSERTALVVHGDHAGVLATMRALGSLDRVETIAGSRVAVLSDSSNAQVLRAQPGATPPVELAPILEKRGIRNETVIGGVLLAAFVIAVLLVIRFRWRSPRP